MINHNVVVDSNKVLMLRLKSECWVKHFVWSWKLWY